MNTPIFFVAMSLWPLLAAASAIDAENLTSDMKFFTGPSCSQLRQGVARKDLDRFESDLFREVASGLLEGSYDKTYRAARYAAYASPRALGGTLKLGDGFSRYENITGMVLDPGEQIVLVGSTGGKRLALLIPDWMRKPPEGVKPSKDPNGWD